MGTVRTTLAGEERRRSRGPDPFLAASQSRVVIIVERSREPGNSTNGEENTVQAGAVKDVKRLYISSRMNERNRDVSRAD
jgi:hypothetical protein